MKGIELCVARSGRERIGIWKARRRGPVLVSGGSANAGALCVARAAFSLVECEVHLLRRISEAHHSSALGRIAERAVAGLAMPDGGR